jgi:prolyl-tRNA editing enzyme YbaK/EbsC (Cys-tRNA(Pro) deacylase)
MVNSKPILIVASGDKRIDNRKFKQTFGTKPVMLAAEQVKTLIGHQVGGVCPFGVNEGVTIYLDESLQEYEFVYPACGSAQSAIQLTPTELATIVHAAQWVNVCKAKSEDR